MISYFVCAMGAMCIYFTNFFLIALKIDGNVILLSFILCPSDRNDFWHIAVLSCHMQNVGAISPLE